MTQFRRHDHEAQAQRRADRFAETADVQHPSPMIDRCKSRGRASFQLQFAEVVVFDDPGVVPPSPGKKCKPARQRHRHPERRLLAWCHNCQCRSGGSPDTGGNIKSFRIDRDSCHSQASQAEGGASERKAWILDPGSHPSKLKPPDRETKRTGESARYEHLRGTAPDAAGQPQVSRDLLSQLRIATRIRIRHRRRGSPPGLTSQDA